LALPITNVEEPLFHWALISPCHAMIRAVGARGRLLGRHGALAPCWDGAGLWPAFWLAPKARCHPSLGQRPGKDGGEIMRAEGPAHLVCVDFPMRQHLAMSRDGPRRWRSWLYWVAGHGALAPCWDRSGLWPAILVGSNATRLTTQERSRWLWTTSCTSGCCSPVDTTHL